MDPRDSLSRDLLYWLLVNRGALHDDPLDGLGAGWVVDTIERRRSYSLEAQAPAAPPRGALDGPYAASSSGLQPIAPAPAPYPPRTEPVARAAPPTPVSPRPPSNPPAPPSRPPIPPAPKPVLTAPAAAPLASGPRAPEACWNAAAQASMERASPFAQELDALVTAEGWTMTPYTPQYIVVIQRGDVRWILPLRCKGAFHGILRSWFDFETDEGREIWWLKAGARFRPEAPAGISPMEAANGLVDKGFIVCSRG